MRAIIIGASKGIGKELAITLANDGYVLGLASRNEKLLNELKKEIRSKTYIKQMDLTKPKEAIDLFDELIKEMSGVDLIIINAGVGHINPTLNWEMEKETIDVNVSGFTAIATESYKYFKKKKSGHIIGISSIAALSASANNPSYNASKAYVSNYLEGLKIKSYQDQANINITDIRPGFVKTDMTKDQKMFWCATAKTAAKQIYEAIKLKKSVAYITKRWTLIAYIMKIMPFSLYKVLRRKKH